MSNPNAPIHLSDPELAAQLACTQLEAANLIGSPTDMDDALNAIQALLRQAGAYLDGKPDTQQL